MAKKQYNSTLYISTFSPFIHLCPDYIVGRAGLVVDGNR